MRILISYEDSYHLYSEALERAFSALLSSIHLSARKWNSQKFAPTEFREVRTSAHQTTVTTWHVLRSDPLWEAGKETPGYGRHPEDGPASRTTHPSTPPAFSPECVDGEFCEVRLDGILRSPHSLGPDVFAGLSNRGMRKGRKDTYSRKGGTQ
jgi:hypothetical protein